MQEQIIGRQEEQEILRLALTSVGAEMVSIIGRRRVGKTFLITQVFRNQIVFETTGIQNGTLTKQLRNFRDQLMERMDIPIQIESPNDWTEAFSMLKRYLKPLLGSQKLVLFFDEVPWLSTRRSGFLEALGYFWNTWASRQNLVLVICGSAASWMIQKVVNNKGGLHNRITKRISLKPFYAR